eukprot:1918638-Rhodomonas_salina.1
MVRVRGNVCKRASQNLSCSDRVGMVCMAWCSGLGSVGGWVVVHRTGLRSSPRGHRRSWPVTMLQCGPALSLVFTFGFGLGWFWFPEPGGAQISCTGDGCLHAGCKDHVMLGWFEAQLLEEVREDRPAYSENQLDSRDSVDGGI